MGPTKARYFLVSLFDYTCGDCRSMHPHLVALQQAFSNELAVISLPTPIHPACNRLIREAHPKHEYACELAQISLAVYKAAPSAWAPFDDWIFSQPSPPHPDSAAAKARESVGAAAFDQALRDPWIAEMFSKSIAIYEANSFQAGSMRMPQVVIGQAVNLGPVASPEPLLRLLETQFGLRRKSAASEHRR